MCLSHLVYTVRPCRIHTCHAHAHTMASVNQTRPHCVNQMVNTHSKPLAARHGRGTAWARHGHGETAVLCCGLEKNGMVGAWHGHGHGMASVNPTRPHCVNQMGKTHSKPLAARHGRGTAWARHAMC